MLVVLSSQLELTVPGLLLNIATALRSPNPPPLRARLRFRHLPRPDCRDRIKHDNSIDCFSFVSQASHVDSLPEESIQPQATVVNMAS
jgi:hypothetical protein